MPQTEAFARTLIDAQLRDQGWNINDGISVRYEYTLADRDRADYLLCGREGRGLATIEAKRESINAADASEQGRHNAEQADVPFVFLANGKEILFWDWQREAHPRPVRTFFSQSDLERRAAMRQMRVDPLGVAIDQRIAGRDYQLDCIETLCREIGLGRRKLLVEMATGTGKTRTAAALIKRLFAANVVTRVLFLVDRIPLAKQTEDAFAEHLTELPCYVLRAGRRFQDEKRITITTLAKHGEHLPRVFVRLFRSGHHRRMPPQHLRQVERRAGTLRRHPDRADRHALRHAAAGRRQQQRRRQALRARHPALFRAWTSRPSPTRSNDAIDEGYLVRYQIYKAQTVKTARPTASR